METPEAKHDDVHRIASETERERKKEEARPYPVFRQSAAAASALQGASVVDVLDMPKQTIYVAVDSQWQREPNQHDAQPSWGATAT